jgi:molecular chaperone IbpA
MNIGVVAQVRILSAIPMVEQGLAEGCRYGRFQRTFQLPEHVKVKSARLKMGMLHIDLVRELPEALKPRRIESTSDASAQTALEGTSEAA